MNFLLLHYHQKNVYYRTWSWTNGVGVDPFQYNPDAYLSNGEILNPDSPLAEQRYDLEMLEFYSGTIVPAVGVTVEF